MIIKILVVDLPDGSYGAIIDDDMILVGNVVDDHIELEWDLLEGSPFGIGDTVEEAVLELARRVVEEGATYTLHEEKEEEL